MPFPSSETAESLLERYRAQPREARAILQVLSVIYAPINQTNLQRVIASLGWKGPQGEPLQQLVAKPLRERLINEGLVSHEKNLLCCHPSIVEYLTRETVAEETFEAIADAAERVVPLERDRYYYDSAEELRIRTHRKLRTALYRGHGDQVLRILGAGGVPYNPLELQQVEPLIEICARPLDPQRFERFSDPIKFQLLVPMLTEGAIRLLDQREAYGLMEQFLPAMARKHRQAAYALVEQRLFRAKLDGVEGLLGDDQSARGLSLLGWLRFLQGRYEESIDCFDASLRSERRATRKRNVCVEGLAGVFYVLAALSGGTADHLKLARKQVDMAIRVGKLEPFEAVLRMLGDAIAVLRGESSLKQSIWLQREPLGNSPYLDLFRCLAVRWLGGKPRARQAASLPRYCARAWDAGLFWYARESTLLLQALGKAGERAGLEAGAEDSATFQSITNLIEPRSPWELALRALRTIPKQTGQGKTAAGSQSGLRMTWRLSRFGNTCALEPREQKLGKSGRWSQGRLVSLQKLNEQVGDFDYLTPQDQRICQHIQAETVYQHFGRYPKTVYVMDHEQALLAATGHPLVFWAEDPVLPVELVRAEPILEVQRRRGQLRLLLEPTPEENCRVVAVQEGPRRLRLVEFSPQHLQIAKVLTANGLTVPLQAQDQVLETVTTIAPLLNVHSDIAGTTEAAEAVAADTRPHIHLQPAGEGVKLDCYVQPFADGGPLFRPGEGGETVLAEIGGRQLRTTRDRVEEQQIAARVLDACPTLSLDADWSWVLDEPETALETLLQLQELGETVVLEWPQGKKIRLSRERGIDRMRITVGKQRDWFALGGELRIEDDRVLTMAQLLELIEQSPGRFVLLEEGEFLTLTQELRKRLDEIRALSEGDRFHSLAAPAIEAATEGMSVKGGKPWQAQLARFSEASDLHPPVPSTLQAELRDYQAEGFRWLARLAHWGAGACLADDMGLGKTVQALAFILTSAPDGPTLVLAPTSVCMNWLEETDRFAPTLRAQRFGPGDRQRVLDEAGPFDLIVCSYGLLQSEAKRLATMDWQVIVADEAQAIKNPLTKRSKAAMTLRGRHKLITTGTPIENHLGELWNLFRFINPGLLGSLERFNQRFAYPIEQRQDRTARQALKKLIGPFILRRLKSDVLAELPPRTEITLHVELSDEEAALYEVLRRRALERMAEPEGHPGEHRFRVLAEIMRLRRACCNPRLVMPDTAIGSAKLQTFIKVLEELRENRHKALVFSQFVDHLSLIREHLDAEGIRYQYLDGATPHKRREAAVRAFQAGDGELFLISLRAGGSGLNLTAADYVIHMDPWWNPAVEDQASDRAHRIGQQRPVTIYRLVAKDTIEDKIVDLHRHKRDLASSLLEGTEMSGKMSVEEMLSLIRGA